MSSHNGRARVGLDRVDQEIIAHLRIDARTTNKHIAISLGIAESTVAARIRSLSDKAIMRIALLRDIHSMGFDCIAHVDVTIKGRSVHDVASDLAEIREVAILSAFADGPRIFAQIHVRTAEELEEVLSERVGRIAGVRSVECSVVLDIQKYDSEFGALD